MDDQNGLKGEKNPIKSLNSYRAFELVDRIKFELEKSCPETVSCADILALATRDSVALASLANKQKTLMFSLCYKFFILKFGLF